LVVRALELKKSGSSYQAIADALGFKARSHAYTLVMEGLADLEALSKESAEELRRVELERLDAMTLSLWEERSNPRVTDSLLRIAERRAKLLGIDAPQKLEHSGKVTLESLVCGEDSAGD
jgi:hypothetical protein